ncbi:MAG TPA: DUF4861 domain-containing protein [Bacteroidales bacterium]|nr:DUF4861 domain-containing protein [Bacteroidales bacterium]
MKFFSFILGFILLSACGQKMYEVTNPSGIDIKDKAFVLFRNEVAPWITDSIGNKKVVARLGSGDLLPSQCDDIDGDGRWDEFLFMCDLKAGARQKIQFETVDAMPVFPVRTNIRFGRMAKPFEEVSGDLRMKTNDTKFSAPVYQMEGPAWENDKIAFRNYYDARNGIDIFGKLVPEMVMDSVGVNGREYHTLHDWGMDILKVGNSLGAGAIAIAVGDSLYRVGPCEEGTYRQISEGPVRSLLELTYKNVPAGDRRYDVIHRIAIYAGDHFYRSRVWVKGLKGDENIVTGIVNLHNIKGDSISFEKRKIMFSSGNQGFSGEVLAMGVIVPDSVFVNYSEAPDSGSGIVSTHLVYMKLKENQPTCWRFAALWENRDPMVKDKNYLVGILKESALR